MKEKLLQFKLNRIKKRGERYKRIKEAKDAYAEYMPEKKERKVSNIMLVIIVVAIIGYVAAAFVLQYFTNVEISSTLTTCWFAFWGAEIAALTGIKVSKVKNNCDNISCESDYEMDDSMAEDEEICE